MIPIVWLPFWSLNETKIDSSSHALHVTGGEIALGESAAFRFGFSMFAIPPRLSPFALLAFMNSVVAPTAGCVGFASPQPAPVENRIPADTVASAPAFDEAKANLDLPSDPDILYHPTGYIGLHEEWRTPWYRLGGAKPGPVVIVEAGIHGDEIAGVYALDNLLPRLVVERGVVIVLPRMNMLAVQAGTRSVNKDLNMVFPGNRDGHPFELQLAAELFSWVQEQEADLVLTLHESRYLHDGSSPKTFGQTIVYGVKPMPRILTRVLDQLNAEMDDGRHKFWPNYYPIATSSTEQFVENFGGAGFCAETWRGFDIDTRVQLQEEVVLAFLDQVGIGYSLLPASQ